MQLARITVPLVLVASLAVQTASGDAPRRSRVDVTGDYTSNWEDIHLVQEGTRVTGTYVCCGGGTIEGRIIEGRVIRFEWDEPRGAGHGAGVWTVTPAGQLEGTWGHGNSDNDGGPWNLVPKKKPNQIAK